VTKEALQENFATLLEDGSVNFSSLNLEEKEGEELAKKLMYRARPYFSFLAQKKST
jgi:hypothetical protein